jgi:hypothetical protein
MVERGYNIVIAINLLAVPLNNGFILSCKYDLNFFLKEIKKFMYPYNYFKFSYDTSYITPLKLKRNVNVTPLKNP